MVGISLYNTRTRKIETLKPLDPDNVRMYVCGPTVYDRAHLGNARPVVVFDTLYRLLRHVYGADHVTYVRNFTDVDDKIIARAAETGRPIDTITSETTQWYLDDMAALGALEPDRMPRATEYIPQMVAMIETLIANGHAYAAEGHVLFNVRSYEQYGALSGRSVDDMIAGARVEVAPYKRDPMDFVLWKPSSNDQPGWQSPWGRGRPGWHIECSAMSHDLLGESFDIHGGGNDLMFPHHENEIAQSRCAHPEGQFANIWMHNEMLQVEGKKMSKSLGNFFTVRDLIDEFDRNFAIENIGPAIRLRLLQGHYREPIDASPEFIEAAATKLGGWWFWLSNVLDREEIEAEHDFGVLNGTDFLQALCSDLNTPKAIHEIDQWIATVRKLPKNNSYIDDHIGEIDAVAKLACAAISFLGFDFSEIKKLHHSSWSERLKARELSGQDDYTALIEELLRDRQDARARKDWARADALRDGFAAAGVSIKDSASGTTWEPAEGFDPAKLETLK